MKSQEMGQFINAKMATLSAIDASQNCEMIDAQLVVIPSLEEL
jgi:hypothetical protein